MTPEDRIRAAVRPYDGLDDEACRLAADTLRRLSWRRTRAGKRCPACATAKPLSAFGPHAGRPDGLAQDCRDCRKVEGLARRARLRARRADVSLQAD